ncbi:phenylacetate--CoA ligase [bacterium]|nr:phenylacetate--CoA ligase [bacterium]
MSDYTQHDFLTRDEILALQDERLPQAVSRAANAPFYAAKLAEMGLDPASIKGLDDLHRLPFTTKNDLRASMPYGMLAVPRAQVVRMHYSSGTTGVATAVYHTADDLRYWAECVARGMIAAGLTNEDVFQNMMGYGLFTGGLGFHYGSELLGCMTIPAGSGNTARQVQLMREFQTTGVHILPSYALRVVHYCEENGIDIERDLALRIGFIGAEPHTEKTRQRVEQMLHVKIHNCYGLSEMAGPGVAIECPAQDGLHVREDHYLVEIIDPETQEPMPEGEAGEMVLTSLNRQAMPLLRYRTRDITSLKAGECLCGRVHRRIERITGRSDDMLIVRGVNLYPLQVERVLMGIEEVGSNYLIRLQTTNEMDDMIVQVELRPGTFFDEMRKVEALRERIVADLKSELLFTPKVEIHQPHALPVSEGKAVRVIDERTK